MSTQGGLPTPVPPPPAPYTSSQAVSGEVSAYELSLGQLRPSQILAERYQILAQIGQGGMGKVYKAEDLNLKRTVVVKVAHSESGGEEKEQARFRREALKMASLSHPNIVSIYDYGEQGGVQYLVMELVDGDMLKRELKESGPFGVERFFEVITQLLEGLSSAHQQQVIHRDIKPSNLMWDQRSSLLKILDFGLARGVEGDTLTGTGNVHGSIQYMAPEQIRGDSQDERTDIYAVGVLAYQLIAGELPFGGESTVELMFHKLQYRPKPLTELLPEGSWVSPALSELIEKCLEIEPDQRVRNASECLAQFKALRQQLNPNLDGVSAQGAQELARGFSVEDDVAQLEGLSSVELLKCLIGRRRLSIGLSVVLLLCVGLSYFAGSLSAVRSTQPRLKNRIELNTTSKIKRATTRGATSLKEPSKETTKEPAQGPTQGASKSPALQGEAPPLTPSLAPSLREEQTELRPQSKRAGQTARKVKRSAPPKRVKAQKSRKVELKEPTKRAGKSSKPSRLKEPARVKPTPSAQSNSKKVEENDVPLIDF